MADYHINRNEPLHSADNPALAGMTALERDVAIANAKRGITSQTVADAAIAAKTPPHAAK